MRRTWDALRSVGRRGAIRAGEGFLAIQEKEAQWWRDAALAYFQTFSRQPIPADLRAAGASAATCVPAAFAVPADRAQAALRADIPVSSA